MDRAFSPWYIHILKPGALPQAGMVSGRWPWVGGIDSHTWDVASGWYEFGPLVLVLWSLDIKPGRCAPFWDEGFYVLFTPGSVSLVDHHPPEADYAYIPPTGTWLSN